MLQNKYSFNQSSTELVISGLPDYSNNDNNDNISIVSSWRLSIINQPEIEGSIDHLKYVIKAFYKCAALSLLDREEKIESELIDLSFDENGGYKITLKSTKPNVQPIKLKIGYAEFSDIINCFDQLKNFKKIKIDFNELLPNIKKKSIFSINKNTFSNTIIPPILALFTISIFTIISIYFFEKRDSRNMNISRISHNPNIVIKIN
tara:strand:- start:959 stop:1573 length:615 start_codon:yes stop_codon:yes gene_type:complete